MMHKKFSTFKFNQKDEYYTPSYLIEPLLEFANPNLKIWCPFDTVKSEFIKTFKANGFKVLYSHLIKGQDFFKTKTNSKNWDIVISNPPFSKKYEILDRLLQLKKPFALLMGIQILNTGTFNKMVRKHSWKVQILTFTSRATYDGNPCSFMSIYLCNKFLNKSGNSCYLVRDLNKENFELSRMYKEKELVNLKKPEQLRLFKF